MWKKYRAEVDRLIGLARGWARKRLEMKSEFNGC